MLNPSIPAALALLLPADGTPAGTRLTEPYVRDVGRVAYLWAWPMINLRNRLAGAQKVPQVGLAGNVPVTPVNHLVMFHDYITARQPTVVCPSQDLLYGKSIQDFRLDAVVVQVPDFGDRLWMYQVCDQRTDGYADLGKMYGTKPGFYLLVGPDWKGKAPAGITAVFRCPTRIGCVIPRVFLGEEAVDNKAVRQVLSQINAYPLSKFDGTMQTVDWTKLPAVKMLVPGEKERPMVVPERFVEELAQVLDEVPPLAGEEALYAMMRSVLAAAKQDAKLRAALQQAARDADRELVEPLLQFRNFGILLPHHWTTITNGAAFGTDYFTRTAVAKSNLFVNKGKETRYFYQDLDAQGERLNGKHKYTVTFAKGQLPPVKGFWSLTLYNQHHLFATNELDRYSLGGKGKELKFNEDGSLTFHVQKEAPEEALRSNWLPAPKEDFSLYIRAYWPEAAISEGKWTPPPVVVVK
jgi:hypothetical protein